MSLEPLQEGEFQETPEGWAQRWQMELSAAREALKKWHTAGDKIVKRFLDERESKAAGDTRWNLFTANVQTQRAMLYGNTPKVTVGRKFADASDDVARVAGELLQRLLNADIERDDDSYEDALEYALSDRLLPGIACARVRYVAEFETVEAKAAIVSPEGTVIAAEVPAHERKAYEDAETDYVHWKDVLWNPSRVWHEVRFVAFRAQMSREKGIARFGEAFKLVPLNTKQRKDASADPWGRADVWEIWWKEQKKVFWFVEGHSRILEVKDDPLGLEGFFPCPRPMFANLTTSALVPRPDFLLHQDLYNEIDIVSTRITLLERAIRVAGTYDKSSPEIARLLSETGGNELIPCDRWAAFAERGGLRGQIDWLPLEQITNALLALRATRTELIDALYQVSGWSDIMRGQASQGGTTATEQGIKARFGSVRIQSLQDEFARFASDIQKLKAEIIAKHFDAQTILERSNSQFMQDAGVAAQAVELIKSKVHQYRIEVKPEAVSFTDFAALKAERSEVVSTIAMYFQAAAPLAQQMPGSAPYLLKILQWLVSGLRGASQIEGVIDQAVQAAEQMAKQTAMQPQQPPPPDPKLLLQQMKGQQDMAKIQAELQADMARTQVEVEADARREQTQAYWNTREAAQKQLMHRAASPPGAGLGLSGGRSPGGAL